MPPFPGPRPSSLVVGRGAFQAALPRPPHGACESSEGAVMGASSEVPLLLPGRFGSLPLLVAASAASAASAAWVESYPYLGGGVRGESKGEKREREKRGRRERERNKQGGRERVTREVG